MTHEFTQESARYPVKERRCSGQRLRAALHGLAVTIALSGGAACAEGQDSSRYRVLFGDLHVHTAYSSDAKRVWGTDATPADACATARFEIGLDFTAITDHDFSLTPERWAATRVQLEEAYVPGTFTTLLGWEWTSSSATIDGHEAYHGYGHRCVLFRTSDVPEVIFRHTDPLWDEPDELWRVLKAWRGTSGSRDAMTIPHSPMHDSEYEKFGQEINNDQTVDWRYADADLQPLVEIFSKHGSSEGSSGMGPAELAAVVEALFGTGSTHESRLWALRRWYMPVSSWYTFPRHSVQSALERWRVGGDAGYRLGIVASTDDHEAAPGSTCERDDTVHWPCNGGIVGVHAAGNTREQIWEALRARRVYGTSGPRIELWFEARIDDRTLVMGEEGVSQRAPVFSMRARAPLGAPVERFEVVSNGRVVASLPARRVSLGVYGAEWTDAAFAGDSWYYVRALLAPSECYYNTTVGDDDGPLERFALSERAWSSPIWVSRRR